jgi:hypothetical protein
MRKIAVPFGLVLGVLLCATAAHANIFLKINDGIGGSLDGSGCAGGTGPCSKYHFLLSIPANATAADPTNTVDVSFSLVMTINCPSRPCTVYFPSGLLLSEGGGAASNDSFSFTDTNAGGPFARTTMFDSATSSDRVNLRGVLIQSLKPNLTLTITYGTQVGDFRTTFVTPYPATASMSGSFRDSSGIFAASSCGDANTLTGVSNPCVKLTIRVNGTTVSGQGASALATAAVPCNNAFPTTNPCGTGGTWSSDGGFSGVNDSNNMDCPVPCSPNSRGTLTAIFNNVGDTLQMAASAHGAMAKELPGDGGLEDNFLALKDSAEPLTGIWVGYTSANQICLGDPTSPLDNPNSGHSINNQSNINVSFYKVCGPYAPLTGAYDMLSILDPGASNGKLIGSALRAIKSSRVSLIAPAGLTLGGKGGIRVLSFTYDQQVGTPLTLPPGGSLSGNLNFADCAAGSTRVEIKLKDSKGNPVGTAKGFLGSVAPDFKSGCNNNEAIALDLIANGDARWDLSGLTGKLAVSTLQTFKQVQQGPTGNLLVDSVAFVNDHPTTDPTTTNHWVKLSEGNVNGILMSQSLQVVTNRTRSSDLPTEGVSFMVTRIVDDSSVNPNVLTNPPEIVLVIPSAGIPQLNIPPISNQGGKYSSNFNINVLSPPPHPNQVFTTSLCLNSSEDPRPLKDTSGWIPRGLCVPLQGMLFTSGN